MDVKLPRLGEGADSGIVVNILVAEGDQIQKDQTILELENEKLKNNTTVIEPQDKNAL